MKKNEMIVIAEDSLTQAVQLQFILENQGYTVFHGKNGKEALALVNEKKPSLVISDIVMPEMDGFELCHLIKSNKQTQNIPVILLTSLTHIDDVINGLECGADSFINKPYSEEFLLLHINNTFQAKKLNINHHSNINFDVAISGKERHFKVDPIRMVSLLMSTYESAINKNIELNEKQKELNALNNNLEDIVIERTTELWSEIAVRKQSEANVLKLNRIYALLSKVNKTIVRIQDSEQFIKDICQIAIEKGGFISAWVKVDYNGLELNGIEEYAGLKNNLHELESPINPINKVYDYGKYLVSNNISLDDNLPQEWKNKSLDFGYKSFIILPINIFGSTCGCCCFYSNEIGFFDDVEIDLLDELAADISFALEYLQNKQKQKQTEKELHESEERFRVLYNSSPDMYVSVSPKDATVKLCNDTLLKKTAYLKEEVIGVPVFNLYHEDCLDQVKKAFEQFVDTGRVEDVELFLKRKDGSKVPVSLNVSAVRDEAGEILYSISSWRDVSEKLEINRQLKMNAAKWQSTFNAITDSVSIIDLNGKIVQSNDATKTLLNICNGDIKEKCCFELVHGMNAPHPNCPFERLKDSKQTESMVFTEKNRWFEVNVDPLFDSNNELIGAVHVVSDITERKKNEIELINAKEKAEESDRLKSAFLTNMSHEIRTPMNAVLGFSQLLIKESTTDKEKKQFAEFVKINGESLMKIIDDIIDISKLQSKLITIKKTDFDLHMVLNELEKYYTQFLEQRRKTNLKLLLEIPESKNQEFYINTDEIRLKQILNNLISNAIKYSEKGTITFGYTQAGNQLNFYIKDTGYGISKENQTKIFERFIQVSEKYVSKHEGTGLGLPISKDLVALLGGELKVKSKEGVGSTFLFGIPLVAANPIAKARSENKHKKLHNLSKYKILIADDEDSNYVLTKRLLKETKVNTDWAMNGKIAVEMAENNNYDLIIMDIKMPDMDGIEATRLIKKRNKNQPIIIQTAFAMAEVKNHAIEAGCDDFIVKPISLDGFLKMVEEHILKI